MVENVGWFRTAFTLKGSIALVILPRILFFSGFGALVSLLYSLKLPIVTETLAPMLGDLTNNVVYNLVLGLLLVFRTNTSYERFWEGRKAWGALVVNIRNLARDIQIGVLELDAHDKAEKVAILRLLPAFAMATKLHLRHEPIDDQLGSFVAPNNALKLSTAKNPPLEITLWIGHYLQQQFRRDHLDNCRVIDLNNRLSNLVDGLTNCERILKTPSPIAYSIFLRRLILIYCLGLPFYLVPHLHWWTGGMVAIVSFILLGVEEVGNELENPFGYDVNDLALDDICTTILENVEDVITFMAEAHPPIVDLGSTEVERQDVIQSNPSVPSLHE